MPGEKYDPIPREISQEMTPTARLELELFRQANPQYEIVCLLDMPQEIVSRTIEQ